MPIHAKFHNLEIMRKFIHTREVRASGTVAGAGGGTAAGPGFLLAP